MSEWLRAAAPAVGGVVAAAGSALCCAGPLLAVTVGVSGAGLAATFEPWRPWFLGATVLFLALGFFLLDREEKKACEPGKPCADPGVRRAMRVRLWTATGLAALLATFPVWQGFLVGHGGSDDDQAEGYPDRGPAVEALRQPAATSPESGTEAGMFRTVALEVRGMT